MRYLNEAEILPYIHAGKEIEQFQGAYNHKGFTCIRYVALGKDKRGYYGLIFEKFNDSGKGVESIYDYSSVEPDDLYGKEIGPFETFEKVWVAINSVAKLDSNRYLISGQLDIAILQEANKS